MLITIFFKEIKMRMRFILMILLIAIASVALVGCKKKEAEVNAVIYVGLNSEFPPFEYKDKGELVGFDVDLMNEISKRAGFAIEYKDMAFEGLIPALQTKKIDLIISGMTATDERRKSVLFSDTYYVSKQAIIIREEMQAIAQFSNLTGRDVGVVIGQTGEIVVQGVEGSTPVAFNRPSEAIIALKANKVDAVVIDFEPAKNFVKQNDGIKLVNAEIEEENYSIAARQDEKALMAKINKALAEVVADGTYQQLIAKHFE